MENFSEELAYWYLRLNGFFVLDNLVVHRERPRLNYNSDIDLIVVRHKFTYERIGGQDIDKDPALFSHFIPNKNIGIICEVKSGLSIPENSTQLDNPKRLTYALRRMGFFSKAKAKEKADELTTRAVVQGDFHQIGRVFIRNDTNSNPAYICISLDYVQAFLYRHLDRHLNNKRGGKLLFSSKLLQYIIWDLQNKGRTGRPPTP